MRSSTHFDASVRAAHDKELLDALLGQNDDAETHLLDFDPHDVLLTPGELELSAQPQEAFTAANDASAAPNEAMLPSKPPVRSVTARIPPDALPCVMPTDCSPALVAQQSRPPPQIPPSTSASISAWTASANGTNASASANGAAAAMSERQIRQMKNRESASKSLWRRKAQLASLTAEVSELTKRQQELRLVIAGLRAENKSLSDQNAFLRSLVTDTRQESTATMRASEACSQLPLTESSSAPASALESGQHTEKDEVTDATDTDANEDI